jgi:hypothetical protein
MSALLRRPLPFTKRLRRAQSTSSYRPPAPPPSNPHRSFYRTFGRSLAKNFLIAVATFQVLYIGWIKLENMAVKKDKEAELRGLEKEVRELTAGATEG